MVSFPQFSPPKPCIHLSFPPYVLHVPQVPFFEIWSTEKLLVKSTDQLSSSLCSFLHSLLLFSRLTSENWMRDRYTYNYIQINDGNKDRILYLVLGTGSKSTPSVSSFVIMQITSTFFLVSSRRFPRFVPWNILWLPSSKIHVLKINYNCSMSLRAVETV